MERAAPSHGPFAGVEPGQAELAISNLNAALSCIGLSEEQAVAPRNVHRAILKADNSPRQPMAFRSTTKAAPPPHRPAIGPARPDAFRVDADDTNLDDIDDDDAVRPIGAPSELLASRTSMEGSTPLPPKLRQALTDFDKIVIQVLLCGAIRLLCVKWLLMQPANFKMPNRQALEEIERSGVSPSPLLSPQEAAALVERGDRSIGALTYGWLSPGDPDPDGSRIRVLRRALMGMAIRIEALFWDFGSLYQAPRTPEQSASFKLALE
eukprot:jgi/Chrpa1/24525/Chrysochromulina_OHIO_Genome00026861-RA